MRAGGLGVLGATGMTVAGLQGAVARARELAPDGPVGVNAQLAGPTPATGERARILEVLRPFRRELGLPDEPPELPPADSPVALVEAGLAAGASVITTFDDPAPVAAATRAAGARLLPMVTTVEEARRAVAGGADALIAQGGEAGGHHRQQARARGARRRGHGRRVVERRDHRCARGQPRLDQRDRRVGGLRRLGRGTFSGPRGCARARRSRASAPRAVH